MKRLILFSLLSLGLVVPVAQVQANQEEKRERPVVSALWHGTFTALGVASLCLDLNKYEMQTAAMVGLAAGSVVGITTYVAKKRNMPTGVHSLVATVGALLTPWQIVAANFVGLLMVDPLLP